MKKILLVISLLILSCIGVTNEVSILDRSNCKFPCWNGIVAGKTTEEGMLEILRDLPEIDQSSIENNKLSQSIFDARVFFSFHQGWSLSGRPQLSGEANIKNNIVSNLILCGKINTSMGLLIEKIGEPEYLISGNDIGGGRTVILIYPQKGIDYSFTTELNNLEILPTTEIDCIHLFDSSFFEEMLDIGLFSSGYYNAEETMRVWYEWAGYGNLDEKYPPRQP